MLQNQSMSEIVMFNLPKVQLRVKTINNSIQGEVSQVQVKEYFHSGLKERLKMKKEIQESYIRSRQHKKNNYIKHIYSTKKCSPNPEDKRGHTIQIKNKKHSQEKIDFALQAKGIQRTSVKNRLSENQNAGVFIRKMKQGSQVPNKELLASSCKPSNSKNLLVKHYSLYDTEVNSEKKQNLELLGEKWNYNRNWKTKRVITHLIKINSLKSKNAGGKQSSFKIQAWKADKISRTKDYQDYGQTQIDY